MWRARVFRVSSAQAAIDFIAAHSASVDVVLSDIELAGGMDGIALASALLEGPHRLPIVLMTGYAQRLDEAVRQKLEVLPKQVLAGMLARALRRTRPASTPGQPQSFAPEQDRGGRIVASEQDCKQEPELPNGAQPASCQPILKGSHMMSDTSPRSPSTFGGSGEQDPEAEEAEESEEDQKSDSVDDAISLLTADHAEVKELFAQYNELVAADGDDSEQRAELVEMICQSLTAHAQIEEEIFYPAARQVVTDEGLLDEAAQEHAEAKGLIQELQSMSPNDAEYDSTVLRLQHAVEHHVQEEESELFPQVKRAGLDLMDLGEQMEERKEEVLAGLADHSENR